MLGCTISVREVTRISDRPEAAEKERKLKNDWVTGNFIVPCAELGKTRRGSRVKGLIRAQAGCELPVRCQAGSGV